MLTYAIAYIRDLLSDYYIVGETYETTVPWSRIHDVCDAVKRVANAEHKRLGFPGKPFTSPRVTQMYHTGSASTSPMGWFTRASRTVTRSSPRWRRT